LGFSNKIVKKKKNKGRITGVFKKDEMRQEKVRRQTYLNETTGSDGTRVTTGFGVKPTGGSNWCKKREKKRSPGVI